MRTLLVVIGMTIAGGAAAANFDGVYTGTRTTNPLRPGTVGCTPANAVASKFIVRNNHFKMKMGNDTNDIVVAPDGTIETSMAYRYAAQGTMNSVVHVNGKIVGDVFQMEIGNEYCSTHVSLKKTAS